MKIKCKFENSDKIYEFIINENEHDSLYSQIQKNLNSIDNKNEQNNFYHIYDSETTLYVISINELKTRNL